MGLATLIRPELLGARLKTARMQMGLTQEAAAKALEMARTTVVAVEAGKRNVSEAELRSFAELYGVAEGDLLSDGQKPLDLDIRFRGPATTPEREKDRLSVASLLNRLASSTIELEEMLGNRRPPIDLPTFSLADGEQLDQQAEDAAVTIRQRLGIGLGPISDLTALMESDLGIRVFERPLPSAISGAVAFHQDYGSFVLLNSNHPHLRRRLTAAHEICHPLMRKVGVSILFDDGTHELREDKFCDAFARALLTPAAAVRRKASELRALSRDFTVRHLLMLAIYFQVSIEAMARRLESLALVPKGLFESLKDRGLGTRHLETVRQEIGDVPRESRFTPRLLLLVGAVHDQGLLSEQQIASKLDLDVLSVRRMLADDALQEKQVP